MAKIQHPNGTLTIYHNNAVHTVHNDHTNYGLMIQAFNEDRFDDFVELMNAQNGNKIYAEKDEDGNPTGIVVHDDCVTYNGRPLHSTIVDRIVGMKSNGHDIRYMVRFLENLVKNPSSRSVNELYDFLANRNLPITEDGCFLAYKSVQKDFLSKYSGDNNLVLLQGREVEGKIDNSVGQIIECPRNEVDDERSNECSKGLHVGGLDYSGPNGWYHSLGDKVVCVKVNPMDVVSVPKDHNAQKLRVCKYEVISELEYELPEYSTSTSSNGYQVDWDEYEEEEYDDEVDLIDLEEGMPVRIYYDNGEERVGIYQRCVSYGKSDNYIFLVCRGDWEYTPSHQKRFVISGDEIMNVSFFRF